MFLNRRTTTLQQPPTQNNPSESLDPVIAQFKFKLPLPKQTKSN
jgi:hypothetical protein